MMRAIGLTDGSAGMIAQMRALAEAMGVALEEHTVTVNKAWHYLPNRAFDFGLAKLFNILSPEPNEILRNRLRDSQDDVNLIISCGRKAALVAASLPSTKRIHIQDPQMSPKHFDVVVAMAHDKMHGDNVISVPYALHSITAERLAAAQAEWTPKFGHLRRPWNAILIGGSTNKYRFTEAAMQKLISEVEHISGALLITTSRRTGDENVALLAAHLQNNGRVYLYTGTGANPYLGMLACADHVYVTNDSVNMMSEAVASGKPVSILKLHGHKNTKPARFAQKLSQLDDKENSRTLLVEEIKRRLG